MKHLKNYQRYTSERGIPSIAKSRKFEKHHTDRRLLEQATLNGDQNARQRLLNDAVDILVSNLPETVTKLNSIYTDAGYPLYVVGGAVRDAFLGEEPKDYDLATSATPEQSAELLKDYTILEVGKSFGITMVVVDGERIEIATFREDSGAGRRPDSVKYTSIENDVMRRDLTINALFYDIEKGVIVDLVGGVDDLLNRVVRCVGEPQERMEEDPLRKLRAIRFAARLGGDIEPKLDRVLQNDNSLREVSAERVVEELKAGVKKARSVRNYFELLEKYDYFPLIFPGLEVDTSRLTESRNFVVIIAILLSNPDADVDAIKKVLMDAKYTYEEATHIVYLISLMAFSPDNAYAYRRKLDQMSLGNETIQEYAKAMSSQVRLPWIETLLDYSITTTGDGLKASGLTGKEIGDEIKRVEAEKFRALLSQ
jgi:tRNA nucleotidyltransferase/poly(A) polymerase